MDYVIGASERSQQRCSFKDEGYDGKAEDGDMDIERNNYKRLCIVVDHAFEELKRDPFSPERNIAYQQAKDQLDDVLADLINAVEKRYRDE